MATISSSLFFQLLGDKAHRLHVTHFWYILTVVLNSWSDCSDLPKLLVLLDAKPGILFGSSSPCGRTTRCAEDAPVHCKMPFTHPCDTQKCPQAMPNMQDEGEESHLQGGSTATELRRSPESWVFTLTLLFPGHATGNSVNEALNRANSLRELPSHQAHSSTP